MESFGKAACWGQKNPRLEIGPGPWDTEQVIGLSLSLNFLTCKEKWTTLKDNVAVSGKVLNGPQQSHPSPGHVLEKHKRLREEGVFSPALYILLEKEKKT